MKSRSRRPGVTLVELMVVAAIMIIIGAVAVPGLVAMSGNANQKAAVDKVRGRIADARGRAMADAKVYRLAIHSDGTRIRVAPDGPDFASPPSPPTDGSPTPLVAEDKLDKVSAGAVHDSNDDTMSTDSSDWVTVATFLPDGTCRETSGGVEVTQKGYPPIHVQIRGLTGATKVVVESGGKKP